VCCFPDNPGYHAIIWSKILMHAGVQLTKPKTKTKTKTKAILATLFSLNKTEIQPPTPCYTVPVITAQLLVRACLFKIWFQMQCKTLHFKICCAPTGCIMHTKSMEHKPNQMIYLISITKKFRSLLFTIVSTCAAIPRCPTFWPTYLPYVCRSRMS